MSQVTELRYSNTNTYLVKGEAGVLLFDTGWAGTFGQFTKVLGERNEQAQRIDCLFVSHFHPDHMGIAQEIADLGVTMVVLEEQRDFIHSADSVFAKDPKTSFVPIRDEEVTLLAAEDSRQFLGRLGIAGEILYTPGHSDDSITLWLDEGIALVGDLNPLYELPMHQGTQIAESWERVLARKPKKIYYGHARPSVMDGSGWCAEHSTVAANGQPMEFSAELATGRYMGPSAAPATGRYMVPSSASAVGHSMEGSTESVAGRRMDPSAISDTGEDLYGLVRRMMKYIDKGYNLEQIRKKTGADRVFVEDVARMYLTHRNVGVQGILDRIEIKNK